MALCFLIHLIIIRNSFCEHTLNKWETTYRVIY